MSRYLDPTNDVAFKKLFGIECHKPLLVSFLNAILALEGARRIKMVEFLTKEQAPLIGASKTSTLDVKCTDERNVQYIVEIQNKKLPGFIKRMPCYAAYSSVKHSLVASDYLDLKPVILLAIANHELFPSKEKIISYHRTLDVETLEHNLQDMSYVFIELPKFDKNEDDLETLQDKWIYFFKNWEKDREVPAKMQEKELIEAYNAMEQFNWNREEMEAYIKANIALTDEYAARQKEREEGLQEGLEKRREEGFEKGRQEVREAFVRSMLKENFSPLQISKVTGLTEKEISLFDRHSFIVSTL